MPSRHTIARPISASGIALHAGTVVSMTLSPAPAGQGVVFVRTDLGSKQIPARYDLVSETRLGTVLEKESAAVELPRLKFARLPASYFSRETKQVK